MRDSLRTTISAFSSAGGRSQARAANVRAVEPDAELPGAGHGNLYMLVEVTGSGGGHPALYRQIFDAAQKAFYETEGTTVTALQRAVRSAHAVVRRVNEALPEANWRAGITCAALQGADLTIAQVSPALALVSHPRTVDQYPPEVTEAARPLGGDDRPEVQLARTEVEPGSIVLLAETRWLEQAQAKSLAVAAALETPGQAVDYLGQLAGSAELSALVIGLAAALPEVKTRPAGTAAAAAVDTVSAQPADRKPPAQPAGGVYTPQATYPAVAPPAPAKAETYPGEAEADLAYVPPPVTAPAEAAPPRRGGILGRFGRGNKAAVEAPAEAAPIPVSAAVPVAAPEPAVAPAEPETQKVDAAIYAPEPRARRSPWPLILALIIIPLLIAAIVFSMWWLRNRSREADFAQALDGASAAITSAQSLSDEAVARQRLNSAKDFLDKAKSIKAGDTRLATVQASYDASMDRINHVTPLYGSVMLWDFTGQGHKLSRVVMKGSTVYVLDQGSQPQVARLGLTGLGDVAKPLDPLYALQTKQQVKDSDQVVGDLVDMTWVDAVTNQRSRLLVLDSAGALYAYDVTFQASRLALAGRESWGGIPQLIASYNGNLYLVDEKANQIWRYKPTDKGYETAPERYFTDQTPDLSGARSIAIDGSIWVLYADGRLIKFFTGKQAEFVIQGVPGSLTGAVAVAASADGDQLYIADTGNGGRIVEISKKTGQFQRQLRPAGSSILSDMRALYLDEAGGNFYILAGSKLYKASLPAAAAPGTATAVPTTVPAGTPAATAPARAPAATATPKK